MATASGETRTRVARDPIRPVSAIAVVAPGDACGFSEFALDPPIDADTITLDVAVGGCALETVDVNSPETVSGPGEIDGDSDAEFETPTAVEIVTGEIVDGFSEAISVLLTALDAVTPLGEIPGSCVEMVVPAVGTPADIAVLMVGPNEVPDTLALSSPAVTGPLTPVVV